MHDSELTLQGNPRVLSHTLRDLLTIGFRRRRLMLLSFVGVLLGAFLFIWLVGPQYESRMKILVKRERMDPIVSTEPTSLAQVGQNLVTEEDLNSEVELIKSRDLLEKVVVVCGLDSKKPSFLGRVLPRKSPTGKDLRVAKAVRKLENDLQVVPIKKSTLIEVTYSSPDPFLSTRVLSTLADYYLQKHLEVHRPPGAFDFFQKEAAQYRTKLSEAQTQLADFSRKQGTVSAQAERDNAMQRTNEFDAMLQQTRSAVKEAEGRIRTLEVQSARVPSRMTTSERNQDAQLLAQLRSTLLTLELKRTELLSKYDPHFPLVTEVETQIAQTKDAIAADVRAPVQEKTTDRNPTAQWISDELSKAKVELASLRTKAAATERIVDQYRQRALDLEQKGITQQDLVLSAKATESNYLLYLNKQEEARISDALDKKRILNVALAETPTVPDLPVFSIFFLVALGGLLAAVVSVGSAFAIDYLDPTFRTPQELESYLDTPLLAVIPDENRYHPNDSSKHNISKQLSDGKDLASYS